MIVFRTSLDSHSIARHQRQIRMSENGKGSKARPFSVSPEVFEENWDRIFRRIPKSDFYANTKRKHCTKNTHEDAKAEEQTEDS